MAFDQATRNRLQRFVSSCRSILSEEFTRQLQAVYGINPQNGSITSIEVLPFTSNQDRQIALLLRETISHYRSSIVAKKETDRAKQAIERVIREQAFTVLNRLAALRMAEARGFLIESISKGYTSKGFQLYKMLSGVALGETGDAYRQFLFSLFDEFSTDLAVLFDRHNSQGRLFPRETALLALLEELNHVELESLWAEDETIGWIYQYFNSQEERQQMRAESQAPRNSRELAVRNQFFTPRYVVEFLTDNTLGRIWYEMNKGKTTLVNQCSYLVRRPNEIFLMENEEAPKEETDNQDALSQEELLKQPVYIPFRPLKDPRTLLMLDPACGSMHFGLYAFDLYTHIYEEAWQLEAQCGATVFQRPSELPSLQESFHSFEELKKAIPKLIIEYNIHGVDIDPRAVQIAGLSLWLRAQRYWFEQGLKSNQRPTIKKSNVVCAEPMPGNKSLLKEFTEKLKPTILGQLVEVIFDKMEMAGEAGSLLKIEEEIEETIKEAQKAYAKELSLQKRDAGYFPGMAPPREKSLFDFADLTTDTNFWDKAEEHIIKALQEYANLAESENEQKRLFAEDAAKGFAFIDLCRKRFDVMMMNPPFGALITNTKTYLTKIYPNSKNDLLAVFVERGLNLLNDFGRLGAITSRTCFFLSTFQSWREEILLKLGKPLIFADLGYGVMDDAMVEAAAFCIEKSDNTSIKTTFFRIIQDNNKPQSLLNICSQFHSSIDDQKIFNINSNSFLSIPSSPFAYWIKSSIRNIFNRMNSFENEFRTAKQGLATADDFRFVRTWWEKPINGWYLFAKGGPFAQYYSDIYLMVNWKNNGHEISANLNERGGIRSNINMLKDTAPIFFNRPGLTWSNATTLSLSVRVLPSNCIFSHMGPSIFVKNDSIDNLFAILAISNSKIFIYLTEIFLALAAEGRKHYEVGLIKKIPFPDLNIIQISTLNKLAKKAWSLKRLLDSTTETSHAFLLPIILIEQKNIFKINEIKLQLNKLQKDLDDFSFKLYNISNTDILSIFENKKSITVYQEDEDIDDYNDEVEHQQDQERLHLLLSWAIGVVFGRFDIQLVLDERTIPAEPDPFAPLPDKSPGMLPANAKPFFANQGILSSDPSQPNNIVYLIQKVLTEVNINTELELYSWLNSTFFEKHLKMYSKSRRMAPIYWPLSTASSSYTLWLYYPTITEQTLYTCVNDFVEPKIKSVSESLQHLRSLPHRSTAEEKEFTQLNDLEAELKDFRDELLRIASFWKPNLNDGVQITAAPLWKLFQHRQWQNKLKQTWEKLEDGEYDWAHLAYSIWPDRVLRKCHQDRSIAIAHDVESDFWEEIEVPVLKKNGTPTGKTKWEWHPKNLTGAQLDSLIQEIKTRSTTSHE